MKRMPAKRKPGRPKGSKNKKRPVIRKRKTTTGRRRVQKGKGLAELWEKYVLRPTAGLLWKGAKSSFKQNARSSSSSQPSRARLNYLPQIDPPNQSRYWEP